jgi:hypothetical protein
MDQAQCVNKQIAQVFTEVTITKSVPCELLSVPGVPRKAAKACPTSVYRSIATKPDRQALAAFKSVNPLYRSRGGHALGVAAKTGTNVPP